MFLPRKEGESTALHKKFVYTWVEVGSGNAATREVLLFDAHGEGKMNLNGSSITVDEEFGIFMSPDLQIGVAPKSCRHVDDVLKERSGIGFQPLPRGGSVVYETEIEIKK